ncbi:MAG TPA: DUF4097 family beta strand repeat-containing protein [Thermoanaerobaculia bacterium]|jgi:DUF4097 and DUF4098 domain-containing protein YvlB|nr:DUF4097 family beta strand repeat-containing protein [Thermoanaerobaculia bacterium]
MRTLLVAATLLVATTAGAAELTETIDRTFDVRAGANVVLSNVNGRVTVSSWDQPRVRVIAKKEVEGDREELKEALASLRVEMKPQNGGLTVITHYPKEGGASSLLDRIFGDHIDAEVTYDVTVPRSMNVDVTNTNGRIVLSDVTGKLELETTNGRIEVKRCSGSLDASTTNGSIEAELVKLTPNEPLRFETTNGGIEVAVPANARADIDASTTNGSISSDLPLLTSRTGSNSLRGTINGGGTSVRLRTTNGGIKIRKTG